ncbi:restriction endonuclease subunit S [Levilactobacillus brevis]|uniref:restriction endonuclease subunit S n=1 Tax=Levilactobacillus brevis TaxID=1580 RepID=UPI000A116878|nr:restriction endonuclease subunit S [Levilactobacillus brevis]ORJ52430.1 restriction endonuclease subunit S [Levilactobacillus brevis]
MKDNQAKYPQLRFKGFTDPWVQRKLTDVGDIARGKSKHRPRNDKKLFGGKYPFVQTGDVASAGLFLTNYSQTYNEFGLAQSKLWPSGTLLITIAANIAETSILGIDAAFPDSVIGFTAKNSDVVFIKTLIDKFSNGLKRKAETSSQANLNLAKLSDLDIVVPNYDEQKQISSFFQNLDNLIAANQRKLDLLKEQKKGYLQKMFPKNEAKVPELRFAGFADAWEQRKLGDLLKEFSIKSKIEDEHKVLSSTNSGMEFREGRVSGTSNLGYKIIKNGDLVLSPQNLWLGNININNIGKGLVSPSYKTFELINIDSSFINPQLRTQKMLEEYKNSSTQGASVVRRNLEIDSFYQIKILVPTISEQEKIGSFFQQLDNTIVLHQRKLDLLKEQKKGFLQNMFV